MRSALEQARGRDSVHAHQLLRMCSASQQARSASASGLAHKMLTQPPLLCVSLHFVEAEKVRGDKLLALYHDPDGRSCLLNGLLEIRGVAAAVISVHGEQAHQTGPLGALASFVRYGFYVLGALALRGSVHAGRCWCRPSAGVRLARVRTRQPCRQA